MTMSENTLMPTEQPKPTPKPKDNVQDTIKQVLGLITSLAGSAKAPESGPMQAAYTAVLEQIEARANRAPGIEDAVAKVRAALGIKRG
jgi:hypothetical protein